MSDVIARDVAALFEPVAGGWVGMMDNKGNEAVGVLRNIFMCGISFIYPGGTGGGGTNQITVGNNGALSTLQTLTTIYSDGAFMYMPAGAIDGSNQAGWYWYVGSTNTTGTLFNHRYVSGDPRGAMPRGTPTPFVSTGPGLITQTTGVTIDVISGIVIPAGCMGPNGSLNIDESWVATNNANVKTASQVLSNVPAGSALTSSAGRRLIRKYRTMNNAFNKLKYTAGFVPITDSAMGMYPGNTGLINFYTDQIYKNTINSAAASDAIILEMCEISAMYGA